MPSGLDLGSAGESSVGDSGDGGWGESKNERVALRIPLVLLVVDPAGAEGELFLHVLEEFVAEVVDAD